MGKEVVQPRAVAVSIPYSLETDGTILICLVSSRKHQNQYVLPKGGIEKGETGKQAAIREMREEAGLVPRRKSKSEEEEDDDKGNDNRIIRFVSDHKSHKKSTSNDPQSEAFVPRAIYQAHEIPVLRQDPTSELNEWPEMKQRTRKWVDFEQAVELISWRKDIHELLLRSSFAP